jgi:hypothetical protein
MSSPPPPLVSVPLALLGFGVAAAWIDAFANELVTCATL